MSTRVWSDINVDEATHHGLSTGCSLARESVYRHFVKPVYTLCWRMLGNEADAMDCTQDIFIKAFTSYHQFRNDSPFWGWLRRIAANCALDRLRKRNRLVFCDQDTVNALIDPDMVDAPDHASCITEQDRLNRAFAALSDIHRSVVWLFDIEGFSHREIADMFERSISFSKTSLLRAHQTMREHLNDETPNDTQDSCQAVREPLAQM